MELKKVILIQIDSILKYPPTLSLINELCEANKEIFVLTTDVSAHLKNSLPNSVKLIKVGDEYSYSLSVAHKLIQLVKIRKECWKRIDQLYDNDTVLWVMSNITVKHLGMKLIGYRYNLHLFELLENIYYFGKLPFAKLDLATLCRKANKVIVCEYNRAQITKTWFKLDELPLIITNKPAPNDIEKYSPVIHDLKGREIIRLLENKKIILYQGIVDQERPIQVIAEAVESLSDEYAFVVMTGSECQDLTKYSKTFVISFVTPPYHLEITSWAYIGILIYTPVYGSFSSPLNSIYCAPNKLYEYAQFGLPMIGNDIPGLKYTIEYNDMGICVENLGSNEIRDAIICIEETYKKKSLNSKNFFQNTTNKKAIERALIRNDE